MISVLRYIVLLGVFSFFVKNIYAQDTAYARSIMNVLASEEFGGRGYIGKGNMNAAKYIANEFEEIGLEYFGKNYFQSLNYSIGSVSDISYLKIDNETLVAGKEFYISNASQCNKGEFTLVKVNDSLFDNDEEYRKSILLMPDLSKTFLVFNTSNSKYKYSFPPNVGGLVFVHNDKLPAYGLLRSVEPLRYTVVDVLKDKINDKSNKISIRFKNKFHSSFKTNNVVGYIKGKENPDSFILIGAHYDHVGKMGNVYFPGANDNASGVAMLLDLANYFFVNIKAPKYTIVFVAFTGEEVGLLGSDFFVKNPLYDLKATKIMINLDMVGTGSTGIGVVNAKVFKEEYELLKEINDKEKYLPKLKARGEACNSDHCHFSKASIPSFFIYTTGKEYIEYHSITDLPQRVPLTNYEGLFKLIRDYIHQY